MQGDQLLNHGNKKTPRYSHGKTIFSLRGIEYHCPQALSPHGCWEELYPHGCWGELYHQGFWDGLSSPRRGGGLYQGFRDGLLSPREGALSGI